MKVLIFSNPNLMDFDIPLVRSLQEKGIDVTYLIEVNSNGTNSTLLSIQNEHKYNGIEKATTFPEFNFLSGYLNLEKVYVRNVYKSSRIPFADALLLTIHNYRFIKKNNFDIIQRTQVFFFTDVLLYVYRKRIIKIVHDPFPHSGNRMKGWTKFFYKLGMKIIPRFVVLNKTQYDKFCNVYKKDKKNVLLNSLGVYDCYNLFHNENEVIKNKNNNVLFFGRISKYKGIEYLCEAMKKVHQIIPDATVTIVGGGEYYFDIDKYRVYDYYTFVNRYVTAKELSVFLKECSIVVCPYTDATQSGVVMTAFSHNKPVVASKVGGLAEQIEDGKNGLLVPPRETEKLADGIIKLLKNTEFRNNMEDYIKMEYYRGGKSWGAIANRYIDFYNKV